MDEKLYFDWKAGLIVNLKSNDVDWKTIDIIKLHLDSLDRIVFDR